MTEWEDDDFGMEYFKFHPATHTVASLYDDNVEVGYLKIFCDTIEPYINLWNKKRKKVRVQEIRSIVDTPYTSDSIIPSDNLWLDMGARLFNTIKGFCVNKKVVTLRIIKIKGNKSKFDVTYFADEYKMTTQKSVASKKKVSQK